jgi:hypothetical protein
MSLRESYWFCVVHSIDYTVDSAYLQSLFVRENFAIKRTLR